MRRSLKLSDEQEKAVQAEGHTMVIACPGSGKTRVLVSKCEYVLRANRSASVGLVTFTREAAAQMSDRLRKASPDFSRRFKAATFHSLAIRQLIGSHRAGVILGPGEQQALLERAFDAHPTSEGGFQEFLARYESAAASGRLTFKSQEDEIVLEAYLNLLAHHSASDLLTSGTAVLDGMIDGTVNPLPYTHIFVDEFQDVDPAQLQWILMHARAGKRITVVGDDDQAIYSFRLSLGIKAFTEFRRALDPLVVHLSTNYRCRPELLALSASLVAHNRQREPKSLRCARAPGGTGKLRVYDSHLLECESIAESVRACPGRWAVIARSNYKLDPVEAALQIMDIPYRRPGRSDFWEHRDCALLLSLLDPNSRSFSVGVSTALARAGVAEHVLSTAVPQAFDPQAGIEHYDPTVQGLSRVLLSNRSNGPNGAIWGVSNWLVENIYNGESSAALSAATSSLLNLQGPLKRRVRTAKYSSTNSTEDTDSVTMLTMHSAKGLEFPNVWVPAVQTDVIPHKRCNDIEEERRLMYVAMSRAEDNLVVSFAWNMVCPESGTRTKVMAPSPFLTVDLGFACERPA